MAAKLGRSQKLMKESWTHPVPMLVTDIEDQMAANRQVERAGVWPERRHKTEPVRKTTRRPHAPSGANRNDDDDDSVEGWSKS